MGTFNTSSSILLNGSFVADTLNVQKDSNTYTNKSSDKFKFFMIDDVNMGKDLKTGASSFGMDGYIGLAPKIHDSFKYETFGAYLKRRGQIKSDSIAVEQD